MNDCPRFSYLINSCKFEARYDLHAPDLSTVGTSKGWSAEHLAEMRKKEYVRDVCIRCGKTIERLK